MNILALHPVLEVLNLNECCIIGKVIDNPELDFIYRGVNFSIAYFFVELSNSNIVKVFGYDEMADYIYKNVKENSIVCITGELRDKGKSIQIEIKEMDIMKS